MRATGENIHPKNNKKCIVEKTAPSNVAFANVYFYYYYLLCNFLSWYTETTLLQRHEVWNRLLFRNFVSSLQKFGEIQYKHNFIQKMTKKY